MGRDYEKAVSFAGWQVFSMLNTIFGDELHVKRVQSIANGTAGVINAASLAVSTIGRALAQAQGLDAKHAIKQVDRLLSNAGVDVWALFDLWVPFVVGGREAIVVALDWTDFDRDDHSTLAIHMVTTHGRATPLMWFDGHQIGAQGSAQRP